MFGCHDDVSQIDVSLDESSRTFRPFVQETERLRGSFVDPALGDD